MPSALAWLLMRSQQVRSRVDGVIEWTVPVQQGAHQAAFLPIGIFDTASAKGLLGMVTDLASPLREEQWAAKVASHESHWCAQTGRWESCVSQPSSRGCPRGREALLHGREY